MQLLEKQVDSHACETPRDEPVVRLLPGCGGSGLDPAAAASRIVRSLTSRQASRLAHEIGVLTQAFAGRDGGAELACALERIRPRRLEPVQWQDGVLRLVGDPRRLTSEALVAETAHTWLRLAESADLLTPSGFPYKPSTLRSIEGSFRLRVVPDFGGRAMASVTKADMQDQVHLWREQGLSASSIHGTIHAARLLWRDFDLLTGLVEALPLDPTRGLRLPAVNGRRERVASSEEARRLIAVLDVRDRAIWATAMYAGLRYGELRALRVEDIDLDAHRLLVRRSWDQYEGEIEPKTRNGVRTTFVVSILAEILNEHLARIKRSGSDLLFGTSPTVPFNTNTISKRARRAWEAAGLTPITLHECRHSAASHMLDAELGLDKISKYVGHSSVTITIDIYGHLMPGHEAESAAFMDDYHARHNRQPLLLTAAA